MKRSGCLLAILGGATFWALAWVGWEIAKWSAGGG